MKRYILLICTLAIFAISVEAQVKTEVNPDVQWKFVRSNNVQLVTGQLQTFEFPAYNNLDYIVNIEILNDTLDVELFIYDVQSQLLAELSSSNATTGQLQFTVQDNAIYQIALRVKPSNGMQLKQVDILMSLLKRPKI
jgi:hypothetical protein